MSLRETLEQLPDDYEVTVKSRYGPTVYTDRARDLIDDADRKIIDLEDFDLESDVYLPDKDGYPLPSNLRAYRPGDIGGHIPPPRDHVLQGPIGEWLQLVEPETEATLPSLGAGVIAALGAYMGRQVTLQVGRLRHHANLFAVQVGPTAKARKGTADAEIFRFLETLNHDFAVGRVASGFGSGESLIEKVADGPTQDKDGNPLPPTDQRLYIQEGEFSKLLRIADRQGSILSDIIRLAFDGGRPLANHAKTSRNLQSTRHCISLFGGITPEELVSIFPALAAVSGTGNRFLWVWSWSDKTLPFGGEEVDTDAVVDVIRRNVNRRYAHSHTYTFTPDALDWWETAYPILRNVDFVPPGVQSMISRSSDQTQRIAVVYAAAEGAEQVTVRHLQAGLAWVEHSIATVTAVLGGLVRNAEPSKILASLRQHPGKPVNKRDLYDVFGRHVTSAALDAGIQELENAGLAYSWEGEPTGGRPPVLVMATTPQGTLFADDPETLFARKGEKEGKPTLETLFADPVEKQEKTQSVLGQNDIEQRGVYTRRGTKGMPNANEVSPAPSSMRTKSEDDYEPDPDDLPEPF